MNLTTLANLTADLPGTTALNLENLTELTSIANLTLVNLINLTVVDVPHNDITSLPSLIILGLQGVNIQTFDFTLVPVVEIVYINSSTINELSFPEEVEALQFLELNNVQLKAGIGGNNFTSLTELIIINSTEFDSLDNNNFTSLTELIIINSTEFDSLENNNFTVLKSLTLNITGITSISSNNQFPSL